MIKERLSVPEYCCQHGHRKLQYVPPSLGEELDLLHRVFAMYDNDKKSKLTLSEVSQFPASVSS